MFYVDNFRETSPLSSFLRDVAVTYSEIFISSISSIRQGDAGFTPLRGVTYQLLLLEPPKMNPTRRATSCVPERFFELVRSEIYKLIPFYYNWTSCPT